jgi:glutathione S-transferase
MTLQVHGSISSRTRRVLWTLEEAGLSYVLHPIDLRKGEHRSEMFRKLNPNARVPTLVDGDLVLFESAAIAMHIAAKVPGSGLMPARGTGDWARFTQWMFWVCTELEQPLWSMGKHRFALPKDHRVPAMLETARFEWSRAAPVLASALTDRECLVGDRFTLADIFAAHTLLWARGFSVDFGSPVLDDYLDRQLARPAYARTHTPPTA